jgi:hypothetical protein
MTNQVRRLAVSASFVLPMLLLAGQAFAQDPAAKPATPPAAGAPGAAPAGPKPKWVEACDADMKKLCKEEMKGDVRPCLFKNLEQLAPDCAKFMKLYQVAEVCKDDIEKLCKEAGAKGQVGKCLIENKDNLSKDCRAMLVKGSKQHQAEEKAAAKAEEKAEKAADKPAEAAPAAKAKGKAKAKAKK